MRELCNNTRARSPSCCRAASAFLLFAFFAGSDASAQSLYWTDRGADKIQRANLDGTDVEDLITANLVNPRGLAIDAANGKMYWADGGTDKIQRANLDGTDVEDLITTGLVGTRQLTLRLSEGKMYWADKGLSDNYRADLDGSNVELLSIFCFGCYGVAVDEPNDLLYTSIALGTDSRAIKIVDLTDVIPVVGVESIAIPGPLRSLALDASADKLYIAGVDHIARVNTDETGYEVLVAGLGAPEGIALFEGKVYWTDPTTALIQRANLDGTSVETLVSGLIRPSAIAIGPAEACEYPEWSVGSYTPNDIVQNRNTVFQCSGDPQVARWCGQVGYEPGAPNREFWWGQAWTEVEPCGNPEPGCATATWAPGTLYAAGDRVEKDGVEYACRAFPYTGWCGQYGFEPGADIHSALAWDTVRACP